MSVIRSPTRYRCAASLNGPTDLVFEYHFYFKRFGDGGEAYFAEHIADPGDEEQLRFLSPVYRASEIRVPVLLVQSGEDRRIDSDHYYRMLNVLEVLGKPHDAYLIEGAGHSPTRSEMVGLRGAPADVSLHAPDALRGEDGRYALATQRTLPVAISGSSSLGKPGRERLIEPYRLIYRIENDTLTVLALFDGRRELEDLLLERLVRSPRSVEHRYPPRPRT